MNKHNMITLPCPIAGVSLVYTGDGRRTELKRVYCDRAFSTALIRFVGALRVTTGLSVLYTQGIYNYRKIRGGERLSLHAYGRAIDITGFRVHGGLEIWVERDWRNPKFSRFWQLMRETIKKVSSPFEVELLTPDSDSRHQDHIHWGLKL